MNQDQMYEQMLTEYKGMVNLQIMQNYAYNCDRSAPHILENARVFQDGDQFCCLKGEDIQTGICGFGKTPREACTEFDRIWTDGTSA